MSDTYLRLCCVVVPLVAVDLEAFAGESNIDRDYLVTQGGIAVHHVWPWPVFVGLPNKVLTHPGTVSEG